MSLDAATYFQHLKAYVNRDYIMSDGVDGKVVLRETYFRPEDTKPKERRIELLISSLGMASSSIRTISSNQRARRSHPCFIF